MSKIVVREGWPTVHRTEHRFGFDSIGLGVTVAEEFALPDFAGEPAGGGGSSNSQATDWTETPEWPGEFLEVAACRRHLDSAEVGKTVRPIMVAITFKVSPEDAQRLRAEARRTGKTLSAHIRAAVLPQQVKRRGKRVIKRHPISGLPYDATDEGGPTVTLEQIKEALREFP